MADSQLRTIEPAGSGGALVAIGWILAVACAIVIAACVIGVYGVAVLTFAPSAATMHEGSTLLVVVKYVGLALGLSIVAGLAAVVTGIAAAQPLRLVEPTATTEAQSRMYEERARSLLCIVGVVIALVTFAALAMAAGVKVAAIAGGTVAVLQLLGAKR